MKTNAVRSLLGLSLLPVWACPAARGASPADKHPFSIDDYAALRSARAVSISPDGKTILYRVSFDGTAGPADKHEWHLMDISGENARKLDLPEHFEPSGFTKDGSLFGIYPVGKLPQLAIVPLGEGKLVQIL